MRLAAMIVAFVALTGGLVACAPGASGPAETPDPTRLTERETEDRKGAVSPEASIYGFTLDEPLSLPPCEAALVVDVPQTCRSGNSIRLAVEERPTELRFDTLTVKVDGTNRLQEVAASLKPESARHVRELLEIRYGKPDYASEGLRSPAMLFWQYADMDVSLLGFSDLSSVTIRTAAQRAIDEVELKKAIDDEEATNAKRRGL